MNDKNFNPAVNLSFVDMVFDENKRNSVYKEYDEKYKSTIDEDEIFKEMTKRRKRIGVQIKEKQGLK